MAATEYGDMSTWEDVANDINQNDEGDNVYNKQQSGEFIKTHIMQYMKVLYDGGYKHQSACKWQAADGGHSTWATQTGYCFVTQDGTLYKIGLNSDENGLLNQWLIIVDVNGNKLPNRWGKDIFLMTISKNSLRFFSYSFDPEKIEENCKTGNRFSCGLVIQKNSWRIPDDYPW